MYEDEEAICDENRAGENHRGTSNVVGVAIDIDVDCELGKVGDVGDFRHVVDVASVTKFLTWTWHHIQTRFNGVGISQCPYKAGFRILGTIEQWYLYTAPATIFGTKNLATFQCSLTVASDLVREWPFVIIVERISSTTL